jgi:hypothetical protein
MLGPGLEHGLERPPNVKSIANCVLRIVYCVLCIANCKMRIVYCVVRVACCIVYCELRIAYFVFVIY